MATRHVRPPSLLPFRRARLELPDALSTRLPHASCNNNANYSSPSSSSSKA